MMHPVKFLPNRVWRAYRGGAGIDRLRNSATPGADGSFPEDWIASSVEANNPQYDAPRQGLSRIATPEGEVWFGDYLSRNPLAALGEKHLQHYGANVAFLMKILDSAERLPIQVHPTAEDARRYFHSRYGKTECWYVFATRAIDGEAPYLLLGFNAQLNRERFLAEARQGRFDAGASMLHRRPVKPGDLFLVPGGTPHAIGPGVTLIEVMEPSDLVVQPELFCGAQPLTASERWSNADPEDALKAFHFRGESPAELLARCVPEPEAIDAQLTRVIPRRLAGCFEVQKLSCRDAYTFRNREQCCRAGVVTAGTVQLSDGEQELELRAGDGFFLPYALDECHFAGSGEVVFALPPEA